MINGQRYAINKDKITWRVVEGTVVILNLESGLYYTLNEVGTKIWELLSKGHNLDEIAELIQGEFEVSKPLVSKDIDSLVNELKEEGLLKVT